MRWFVLMTLAGGLAGCIRDLPESELGDDARLLFRDFDDDPDALAAIVERMDKNIAKLDLDKSARKRLSDLPELSEEFFGGADISGKLDTKDQMRAAMVGLSHYGIDDNMRAQVQENMTCANARSVECHERLPAETYVADDFLAGDDPVYRTENTIRIKSVIDFWIQAPVDFRWVELSDGRRAVVGRTWIDQTYDSDNGKYHWKQRFGVDLFIEDPKKDDQTRRFYGTWLGPSVGGLPGYFLQPALRKGLDDGFTQPDAWLDDGGKCDVSLKECLADAPF